MLIQQRGGPSYQVLMYNGIEKAETSTYQRVLSSFADETIAAERQRLKFKRTTPRELECFAWNHAEYTSRRFSLSCSWPAWVRWRLYLFEVVLDSKSTLCVAHAWISRIPSIEVTAGSPTLRYPPAAINFLCYVTGVFLRITFAPCRPPSGSMHVCTPKRRV